MAILKACLTTGISSLPWRPIFLCSGTDRVNSFFINYVTETISGVSTARQRSSSPWRMGLFWAGRLSAVLYATIQANRLLSLYAAACAILMVVVIAVWVDFCRGADPELLFMSIMFPRSLSWA